MQAISRSFGRVVRHSALFAARGGSALSLRRLLALSALALVATLLARPHYARAADIALALDRAWTIAEEANPELRAAKGVLAAAQGEVLEVRAPLYNNPELNGEGRRRSLFQPGEPNANRTDWGVGVSQTFEVAGQQGLRRHVARTSLLAAEAQVDEVRRRLRMEVENRFVQILALQRRIATERIIIDLIERNAQFAAKRVQVGEDSKLDGNVALIEAERAHNQLEVLGEQLLRERAELAKLLQLPVGELPIATGELAPATVAYTAEDLLAAISGNPSLRKLTWRETAARSRVALEKAVRWPNVTVSLNFSRERSVAGADRIATLGLAIPLPLFRHNDAAIGRAIAELDQARLENASLARDTRAAVLDEWSARESLQRRVYRLNEVVAPKLEENLSLSRRAYISGEIGLPQLLLVQRQTLDAQRDLIEAQLALRLVHIKLEYAANWPRVR